MNKRELKVYNKQISALILLYIACMLPLIFTHPKSATMNCDSKYVCKIEMTYNLNIKRSADLIVNSHSKMRFYNRTMLKSGIVNIYDSKDRKTQTINADPFGRTHMYVCTGDEVEKQKEKINNDKKRFDDYIKNPVQTFSMRKDYDNKNFYIISGILTFIFICFALTKEPITNLFHIIGAIIFSRRY